MGQPRKGGSGRAVRASSERGYGAVGIEVTRSKRKVLARLLRVFAVCQGDTGSAVRTPGGVGRRRMRPCRDHLGGATLATTRPRVLCLRPARRACVGAPTRRTAPGS